MAHRLIEPSKTVKDYLAGVMGICEANSFERMCLWREHTLHQGNTWDDRLHGYGQAVGVLGAKKTCYISLYVVYVDDVKIVFLEPTSKQIDWNDIERWLDKYLSGVLKVDAQNFYNLFPIKEAVTSA